MAEKEIIMTGDVQKEAEAKNLLNGYIGTYYSEKSKGIYQFSFDPVSGRMTEPELFYEAPNAKWVSLNGSSMAFPVERNGRAGTCFLKLKDGEVSHKEEILEEKQTPCYVLQKNDFVYTANYHEGTVMVYRLDDGTPFVVKRIENGAGAGCHQIMLHETYLMVPCLEQNKIRLFDMTDHYIQAGEILFPEGSGPRHGIFNRDHTRLYVVSEWSNELFVFRVHGKEFVLIQSISVLPEGGEGSNRENAASAAIRLTKDEAYLYISVRGADLLAVFEIREDKAAAIQHISCGGAHPRDFILSENEDFILTANRFGGGIACIERDRKSGLLKSVRHRIDMPEAVSLLLVNSTQEASL
ncbi:beta-propeller fold lactonase family protein [Clostridium sp. AM58-1XD]|uniref:lactonase family protein n=1 Tax=Clostridium sp. AM58-1XD TaxID=2292307 RepID=UPI000E555D14|nr:beta-propeller fold lactonase family protein [Clostridium sp. AM58-1XD]RGZ01288.1 lactonase family protein [Clostridium sp. AM58-1XD]